MGKSLDYVKECADQYNKGLISDGAFWTEIDYYDQLDESEIEVDGDEIVGIFNFDKIKTELYMTVYHDPDANFRTMIVKGGEIGKFGSLKEAKKSLTEQILSYFINGDWVSDRIIKLGEPLLADFYIGNFVCAIDSKKKGDTTVPIMVMFLPVTLNFELARGGK